MSRELLISQVVMAAAIAVVIALALFSEDRGLAGSVSRAQESRAARAVAPPLTGFGAGQAAPVDPVMCPGGATSAYPIAVGGLAEDCAALLSAAPKLVGDGDGDGLDWDADVPITEWTGVIVTGSPPRVVVLDLTVKGLEGVVPPELGNLSELYALHLYGNELTGEIPPELGSLARLAVLNLSANALTGGIPSEIGRLTNLVEMDLSVNRLTGDMPQELGNLANLKWLAIEGNRLTGSVTPILENLSELTYINVQDTDVDGCVPVVLSGVDGFMGAVPVCAE